VLPLVPSIRNFATVINDFRPGWSTHYFEFADMPEVEHFCGGINSQTPRSSAFWRQGNLLHFGFEQSPAQLNDTGRAMLVNAIACISRFTEDRPIDITPSVFGDEKFPITRRRIRNYLTGSHPEWGTNYLSAAALSSFNWRDRAASAAWLDANAQWLAPKGGYLLDIDKKARSLGTPFDSPEFLEKTITALRDENTRATAVVLLARYFPDGPVAQTGVESWAKWRRENEP